MRVWILLLAAAAWLMAAPAFAAPTCFSKNGNIASCRAPDAMPPDWTPSPKLRLEWHTSQPEPTANELLGVALGLCLFLAMIALLPEFDGSRGADWGSQESDDREDG